MHMIQNKRHLHIYIKKIKKNIFVWVNVGPMVHSFLSTFVTFGSKYKLLKNKEI